MRTAVAAAAGFFVGVILVLILGAGNGGKTKTVTVSSSGKGGAVVVTVPRLVGERLDVTSDRVERSGFDLVIDSGGGLFGPLIDSDWTITSQDPSAGKKVRPGSTIHVDIDRR